jgi:Asp-tRNA(Asn)/Glu-tRNA(Gln) amidotransferase A subunit family amidase
VGRGERLGALAGVPFLVKDAQDLAGVPTRHGSLLLADAPPAARDTLAVARLRAAGAIPVGKTSVPEFCFEGFTSSRLSGDTRNPWAPDWSPGGSSGGSAAAMAAGMVPFATATDGGGSVRIPAAFCGLYGLKPTNGVIARDPVPQWIDFTTDGQLALSMADLRLLLRVQAGPSSGDPTALPEDALRGLLSARSAGRPSLVLAAPRLVDWGPLPNAIADLFDAALTSLEKDLGLRVEPLAPGQIFGGLNVDEDWTTTCSCEQARAFGEEAVEAEADRLHPSFLAAMRRGLRVTLDEYLAVRRRRFEYVRVLDDLLGADRVIVTPTMPVAGFMADGREVGADHPGTAASSYNTQAQNVTGHPALTVPGGVAPNGVPFGLQITGPRFAEPLVLALGEAWERVHPARRAAPGYQTF